jgi:hypothetical protein
MLALELDRRRADGGTTETAAAVVEPSIGKPAEVGTTERAAEPNAN